MRLDPATHVFVDGNNVMGSRPDGWWRDRSAAARRLLADLAPLARGSGVWTVVFDGPPPSETQLQTGTLRVEYAARDGADAADDRIVELIGDLPPGNEITGLYVRPPVARAGIGARRAGRGNKRPVAGGRETDMKETASWGEFETASPELARLARGLSTRRGW